MKRPRTPAALEMGKWLSSVKRSRSMVRRSGSRQWTGEALTRLQGWCKTIDDPRDGCDLLLCGSMLATKSCSPIATTPTAILAIADWHAPPSHETYLAELRARHGIKKAFWALV